MIDALQITPAAVATSVPAVFQTTAGANLILPAPGSNRLKGRNFTVQASGYVMAASGTFTATIQPILYGDASLATVSTKPLFSATAGTFAYTGTAGGAIPWSMWAEFEGDTLSGTFSGIAQSMVGSTIKAQTVTVAPVSSINFASEPPIKFAVGIAQGGTIGASPKYVITELFLRADNE